MDANSASQPIGYPQAHANQRASWAMWNRELLRGDCDVVPPMDPRVPVLVAAREFVRRLRQTQDNGSNA